MIKKGSVNKLLNQLENRMNKGLDLVDGSKIDKNEPLYIYSRFIDVDNIKAVILPTVNGKVLNIREQTQINYLLSNTNKIKKYFDKNKEHYSETFLNGVYRLPNVYNNLLSRYLDFKEIERVSYSTEEIYHLLDGLDIIDYAGSMLSDTYKHKHKEAWYIELTELLEIFECERVDLLGIYHEYRNSLKDSIMTAICLNNGGEYEDYIEEVKVGKISYYRAKDISKADEIISEYEKAYEVFKSLA